MANTVKVTLIKSVSGRIPNHKLCVKGLGLRRIGHTVEVQDTPENRGMINKAYYMLRVEGLSHATERSAFCAGCPSRKAASRSWYR